MRSLISPEQIDAYRLVPRLLVALYGLAFYQVIGWFMTLPDPNPSQAAFVSSVVGAGAAFFGFYVNAKREHTPPSQNDR